MSKSKLHLIYFTEYSFFFLRVFLRIPLILISNLRITSETLWTTELLCLAFYSWDLFASRAFTFPSALCIPQCEIWSHLPSSPPPLMSKAHFSYCVAVPGGWCLSGWKVTSKHSLGTWFWNASECVSSSVSSGFTYLTPMNIYFLPVCSKPPKLTFWAPLKRPKVFFSPPGRYVVLWSLQFWQLLLEGLTWQPWPRLRGRMRPNWDNWPVLYHFLI